MYYVGIGIKIYLHTITSETSCASVAHMSVYLLLMHSIYYKYP